VIRDEETPGMAFLQHQNRGQNIANAQNSNKRICARGQSPLMKLMEKSQTAFEERTRPADGIEESMKSEFLSSRE